MLDLKLDNQGDLDISGGLLHTVQGISCVAQTLNLRLRINKGEWFLDTRIGIPYFTQIFVSGARLDEIESLLLEAVSTAPGVLSVDAFDVTLNANRQLQVTYRIHGDNGDFLEGTETLIFGE